MNSARSIILVKRDGTLERFNPQKLRACLFRVLHLTAGDPAIVEPVVRAITLHLRQWPSGEELPDTDHIYRCVQAALIQLAQPEAARALAAHRRLRQARRQRVRVYDPLEPAQSPVPWRKSELVATLQSVYDLRQATARFLAGQIEDRVFTLGYRLLSKPFVAELTRNEVLAWGLLFDRVSQRRREPARDSSPAARPRQEES